MTRVRGLPFLWIILLLSLSGTLQAANENRVKSQARWDTSENNHRLIINVADVLTPSQREMINSGFTTFSVFSMGDSRDVVSVAFQTYRRSCTVKYDTWEDRYEVGKIDPAPFQTELVKDYKSWAQLCLEMIIEDPKLLSILEQSGEINGSLNIRQSTADEAAKIKSWLVKQQSGFMQGLYSHMLGNFQYQHQSIIRIGIPKRPIDKPRPGAAKS